VSTRSPERDVYLAQVLEEVRDRLAELRIRAEVTGRPKHYWSIYEKMVVKGREFNDIFDLVGDLGIHRSGLAATGLPGDYDVYGFGTYTESFEETMRILRMIRAERPESRFLLGGYHATIASQQVMADHPEVDAIVLNEGEYACADLLDAWASGGSDLAPLPGVLVRREELAEEVWGTGLWPVNRSLDVHMSSLRRKLGDTPRQPRYVQTVHGLGFRLLP